MPGAVDRPRAPEHLLTDSSIAENIAFGLPLNQIDLQQVRRAAQQAQIATFIESSPQGYNSFVGEGDSIEWRATPAHRHRPGAL